MSESFMCDNCGERYISKCPITRGVVFNGSVERTVDFLYANEMEKSDDGKSISIPIELIRNNRTAEEIGKRILGAISFIDCGCNNLVWLEKRDSKCLFCGGSHNPTVKVLIDKTDNIET